MRLLVVICSVFCIVTAKAIQHRSKRQSGCFLGIFCGGASSGSDGSKFFGAGTNVGTPVGSFVDGGGARLKEGGVGFGRQLGFGDFFGVDNGGSVDWNDGDGNIGGSFGKSASILDTFNFGQSNAFKVNPRTGGTNVRRTNNIFEPLGIRTEEETDIDVSRFKFGNQKRSCFLNICIHQGGGVSG